MDAAELFALCSSTAKTKADRAALQVLTPDVVNAVAEYESAAETQTLHTLKHLRHSPGGPPTGTPPKTKHAPINRALTNGYTTRMVPEGRIGHSAYLKLRSSAPDGKCSLCGHITAGTLDHQLPKMLYPLLAVAPSNLAPACLPCNTAKGDVDPVDAEQQTLNPYFDHEAEEYTWLRARVTGPPFTATFHALPPPEMPDVLAARAQFHFRRLKLADLYVSQVGGAVRVDCQELKDWGRTPPEVRDHFARKAELWSRSGGRNCWQAALYSELATNTWFTTEDYLQV
ncbi:hypothetical protein [Kitasatospora phosalacinea]|uniref:hypothetical protein n=1 Tax=Kitasatospora phosalacinea TaxID=2065 RepID=UPI00131D8922|nr:hypothetical protein [Kitasatospora phosalacinea]